MSGTPSGNRGNTTKWPSLTPEYKAAIQARRDIAREVKPRQIDFGNREHDDVVVEKYRLQEELSKKGSFPSDEVREFRDQLRYQPSLTEKEVKQLNALEKDLYVRLWYMLSDFQNLLDEIQDYDSSEENRAYYDTLQKLHVEFQKQLGKLKAKIAQAEAKAEAEAEAEAKAKARAEAWEKEKQKRTRSKRRARMNRRTKTGYPGGYGKNGLLPLRF